MRVLLLMGAAWMTSACPGFGSETLGPTTDVTWDKDIRALLETRCVPCHQNPPQNGAPSGFVFSAYDAAEAGGALLGAKEKADRILSRAVMGIPARMPPGGMLSDEEQAQLLSWIDGGTPR